MRTWFWTLLLAVVAVALAVVLRSHTGNVIFLVSPWRIELSLTLFVLLVLGGFVALYVALRVLSWLLAIPDRMRVWRGHRAQARDHDLLERGWTQLLEGRYGQAEKDLTKLLGQTRVSSRRVLAALSAARAAHGLGEFARRDRLLDAAREHADGNTGLQEAIATVAADQLLDQGRAQDALAVLTPLQEGGARHLHTLRLLLRAESALNHHDRVFTLARGLMRRNALSKVEAESLIDRAGAARLRAAAASGTEAWRSVWKDFKSDERVLPEIALAGAMAFESAGEPEEAARILETAIPLHFTPSLIDAYARCDADQVPRRLAKAEAWLQKRPTNVDLLTSLGMLCLNGQLWGQAEHYLQRSVQMRNDARTHALLGSLYDRLDRSQDAVRHWRLATTATMALPVLAGDLALPPADTNADPAHLDAEGEYSAYPPEFIPVSAPVEVLPTSAPADYVLDPDARAIEREAIAALEPDPPAVAPARGDIDIEEYFDSAPIPVPADDAPRADYGTPLSGTAGTFESEKRNDDKSHLPSDKQG
ncbi:heme biosynthesis HemY N-terminal domain-containing protein [Bordetella sp. 15P40C-2]|uniref:heme biosynthesis HemY N-terminal domain-containing protein n=1 Tax=Bordetella sp. 15P40C-2 TaxID=2572246 RepID=UPI001322C748|nr:heme biosynthesis HemY N-terminal domain-containing protein [Bordetella sp. 15P40C-2]MVW72178.1 protoheme IX synthesis protein [Bordetella sp. 15P40C-2]